MYIPEGVGKVLLSGDEIARRVRELGQELTKEYKDKNPLFICVLKGASVFFCDLIRQIECPLEIDFMHASSYIGTESGELKLNISGLPDIRGRHVVIVEDIVDTAKTLSAVCEKLREYEPASLKTAALLDKPSRRVVKDFKADYTGFEIEDLFVVGCGLDCDQKYRNLPFVGVVNT